MCSCSVLWNTYNKVPNTRLTHSVVQTTGLSESLCCSECDHTSWCGSLSYKPSSKECQLSDKKCTEVAPSSVVDSEWVTFVKNGTPCIDYLVSGPNGIPDNQLSESSVFNSASTATSARLNSTEPGCWAPNNPPTDDQYVQADFAELKVITAFAIQGRYKVPQTTYTQFVTRFRVLTSLDCVTCSYIVDESNAEKVFDANSEPNQMVTRYVPRGRWFLARCVRINPVEWSSYPSLRFDVLGF